jgi:hypothetical protein
MLRSVLCALALVSVIPAAQAHGRHHSHGHHGTPWCGIYLSHYLGKHDRNLALARNWAHEGSPAAGPGVGVVAVWPHHVGIITGRAPDGEWIVHSGNDGNAVRTRPRSLAGVIAFRYVS